MNRRWAAMWGRPSHHARRVRGDRGRAQWMQRRNDKRWNVYYSLSNSDFQSFRNSIASIMWRWKIGHRSKERLHRAGPGPSNCVQSFEKPPNCWTTCYSNRTSSRSASCVKTVCEDELQPSGASSHVQHTSAINGTVHLRFKNRWTSSVDWRLGKAHDEAAEGRHATSVRLGTDGRKQRNLRALTSQHPQVFCKFIFRSF